MITNDQTRVVYDGDARELTAVHEAGHAVAHLLLGHHVIAAWFDIIDHGDDTETADGTTRFTALNTSALADLVATAAGEAAALSLLTWRGHPEAKLHARVPAAHDRERARRLAGGTTLPLNIGAALAPKLVFDHWDAITRVAGALCDAPNHRLEAADLLDAAALGDTEIGWERLSDLASAAMPDDAGLQAYLAGPGRQGEQDRAEFLDLLWTHGLLDTPRTGLRRQVHAETHRRGLTELQAQLDILAPLTGATPGGITP